ncbi:DUF397 domain-containing protein [Pseudonocardia pini]|uniref:DUF397 domain-containing protein n=1 Tax=Pseudonocardia pini TaxID=2758030 RepID=UPI0015F12237|nr:DUF397 domain-containing protein [Pseudonocardia pini]
MIEYRTSSFCSAGSCVAVGRTAEGGYAVIDTKDEAPRPLHFTSDEWAAFVAGVKNGEFDPA